MNAVNSREDRESMAFDVVVVGAGIAGLSTAIQLKQSRPEASVCILEKAAEVGNHVLSGAVFEPRALNELLPDWQTRGAPLDTPAVEDHFLFLTKRRAFRLPTPAQMHNKGNYIISLGKLCRWLAEQAEALEIEIFPGFAATEVLYDAQDNVVGVATGDMGIDKDGSQGGNFQPGMELFAAVTVFAEGCRGSLSESLIEKHYLRRQHQTYGIGIKEQWEIDPAKFHAGRIIHTIGWPLKSETYGGSFLYHFQNNVVSVGFVVGLDYTNPYLSPYEEFQRFKHHPAIAKVLEGGRRISYGARALNEGGFQSIPELAIPGAVFVGCAAGFLNVPKIKGSHLAMKSGIEAGKAIADTLAGENAEQTPLIVSEYPKRMQQSWLWKELKQVRNIRPSFKFGMWFGLFYSALETYILRGLAPWTFSHAHRDDATLTPAARAQPIEYPAPDGVLSFDRLTNLAYSGVDHTENQPAHLKLYKTELAVEESLNVFAGPEARFCPAGVYEFQKDEDGKDFLQINAQNCVHCKTCDIKVRNIHWTVPEGGGGPNYELM